MPLRSGVDGLYPSCQCVDAPVDVGRRDALLAQCLDNLIDGPPLGDASQVQHRTCTHHSHGCSAPQPTANGKRQGVVCRFALPECVLVTDILSCEKMKASQLA